MLNKLMEIISSLTTNDLVNIISLLFIGVAGLVVWRLNRSKDNNFDIVDLFATDGIGDYKKFTWMGSWLVCTWMLVYLTYTGKLSEWFFTAYVTTFVLGKAVDKFVDNTTTKKEPKPEEKK